MRDQGSITLFSNPYNNLLLLLSIGSLLATNEPILLSTVLFFFMITCINKSSPYNFAKLNKINKHTESLKENVSTY